jgi:hypothetical protein
MNALKLYFKLYGNNNSMRSPSDCAAFFAKIFLEFLPMFQLILMASGNITMVNGSGYGNI